MGAEDFSSLLKVLAGHDRHTVIYGLIVVCIFLAMVLGVNPLWALGVGCALIAIYPIREYALVRLRNDERREELKLRLEGGSNQAFQRHAMPSEKKAIEALAERSAQTEAGT